jgi:quinoprotein glucose dehydrogenase
VGSFLCEELARDKDPEIRAQVARALGDLRFRDIDALQSLMKDKEPRVRLYAALACGRRIDLLAGLDEGISEALATELRKPYLELLRDNADADPYLRHASAVGLAKIGKPKVLLGCIADEPASVRLGVLLALRRLGSPEIAKFLNDPEPRLVAEAARAIHDVPIGAAMSKLAALTTKSGLSDHTFHRALNAHFQLGKAENAAAVAAFAGLADASENLRVEAVRMLGEWAKPTRRDRITGVTQNLGTRDAALAADALRKNITSILAGPDKLREEAARVGGQLGIKEVGPILFKMLAEKSVFSGTRVEIVQALDALDDERLPQAIKLALADDYPRVRIAGRHVLVKRQPSEAIAALRDALDKGEVVEQQAALTLLGESKMAEADPVLSRWLDRLMAGKAPPALHLELLEAAEHRSAPEIKQKLARFEASRKKTDSIASYREALFGGNGRAGREIFLNKTEVACLRCHKVHGEGGEVGPDLTGIGAKQTREYLLESIVDPNKQIAKGFETVVLALKDGTAVSGVLKEENEKEIRLITPEAAYLTVTKKDVDVRETGKSAMPEDAVKHLTKRELRDLVEFLAGLKGAAD